MRVLIHVQHLLGIGHLQRIGLIARALDTAGAAVTMLSGGMPWPGLDPGGARLVQLPPLRAGAGGFGDLVDAENRPLDAATRARRRWVVLDTLAETRPDLVLIETYPFGRRALRFELEPLVEAARALRPKPILACSIRDIVAAKPDPARRQAIVATLQRDFDRVLVHADPRFIRLEASFPEAKLLADRLHYTGFVAAPASPPAQDTPAGEIVVSAGGGAAGAALLKAAKAARPLSRYAAQPWRLITGRNLPAADFAALARDLPPGLAIERHRGDFPALLARARLSVSQAGYNTVLDLLQARVPAVLVPFAEGGETEQSLRAARLQALRLAETVAEAALTPETLAAAIDRAAPPAAGGFALDGAERSAALLIAAGSGAVSRHATDSPEPC
jgi:predicted glycosyltransferase